MKRAVPRPPDSGPLSTLAQTAHRLLTRLFCGLVNVYRWFISPMLGTHCRFHPTCSRYALEAIRCHGCWRGGAMALRRLSRCHPFHPGGFDPVPEAESAVPDTHALH